VALRGTSAQPEVRVVNTAQDRLEERILVSLPNRSVLTIAKCTRAGHAPARQTRSAGIALTHPRHSPRSGGGREVTSRHQPTPLPSTPSTRRFHPISRRRSHRPADGRLAPSRAGADSSACQKWRSQCATNDQRLARFAGATRSYAAFLNAARVKSTTCPPPRIARPGIFPRGALIHEHCASPLERLIPHSALPFKPTSTLILRRTQ
jgi:hypothetical protein